MKKQYIAAFCCILAASCSKAELNEVNPGLWGEKITVTVPAQTVIVPAQTKAAINGNTYAFEGDEQIIAVASNGSKATLTNSASSLDNFTGTFDKPVTDGSTINFYYNAASIAEDGTAAFTQNGKPWLHSKLNSFTRNENNEIAVSATLAAPENVRAIAVITSGSGIESLEFHAKDTGVKLSGFNGTAFDGESSVSQTILAHGELGNSNIFYVPKDMEGGFWIKAVKGQQAMYKSYASSETISANKTVEISEFTAAKVDIDVQISGFTTSYSYAKGIDGVAQSIATANSMSNDWMDAGQATYSIARTGIPSTLLKFESFKLTIDGQDYTGDEASKLISIDGENGHTTWGQKDIVATVVYKDLDGNEYIGTKTVTRHITGLPYIINDFSLAGTGTVQKSYTFKTPSSTPIQVVLSNTVLKTTFRGFDFETYASDNKIGTLSIAKKVFGNEADYSSTTFTGTLEAGSSIKFKIDDFDRSLTCKVSKIEIRYK